MLSESQSPGSRLLDCLDALDETQRAIAELNKRTDPDHGKDLLVQRRLLAERLLALHQAATAKGGSFAPQQSHSDEFQMRYSEMRAKVAQHQALWSVVSIPDRRDEYRASAVKATQSILDFTRWVRTQPPGV